MTVCLLGPLDTHKMPWIHIIEGVIILNMVYI